MYTHNISLTKNYLIIFFSIISLLFFVSFDINAKVNAFSSPTISKKGPLSIKSDEMIINSRTQTYTYLNHVVVDYGRNSLHSNSLTVFMHNNQPIKLVALGKPAHLKLFNEKNEQFIKTQANTITSFPKENKINLTDNASLQYDSKQLSAYEISINTKNYDILTHSSVNQKSTLLLKQQG